MRWSLLPLILLAAVGLLLCVDADLPSPASSGGGSASGGTDVHPCLTSAVQSAHLRGRLRAGRAAVPQAVADADTEGRPLRVVVTDDGCRRVAGATIEFASRDDSADNPEFSLTERSEADGSVRVPPRANLKRFVRIKYAGCFPHTCFLQRPSSGNEILIRLTRHVPVRGTVLDGDGNPVPGAKVVVDQTYMIRYRRRGRSAETRTDNHGRWCVTAGPGRAEVRIEAKGYPSTLCRAQFVWDDPFDWEARLEGRRRIQGWIHAPELQADAYCEVRLFADAHRTRRGPARRESVRRLLERTCRLHHGDAFLLPLAALEAGEACVMTLHMNGSSLPSKTLGRFGDEPMDLRVTIDGRCPEPARITGQVPVGLRASADTVALQEGDGAGVWTTPDATTGAFVFEAVPPYQDYTLEVRDAAGRLRARARVRPSACEDEVVTSWRVRGRRRRP